MEKVKPIPISVCGKLECKSVVVRRCAGAAQERHNLVYPREKWDISEVPDLSPVGESGWGAHGVRKSPAWIYNGDLICVTRLTPDWGMLMFLEDP